MPAGNNNFVDTDAKIKDFLNAVLSSEGIVVDIRRTFINYNGVNRSRVFARRANEMASKGGNEKFVVIALMCYPALQWILQAQDIDRLVEELREQNPDESVSRMSNIQRVLESSLGGCKPQLRLEMRKVFFARCQQLVDAVDEAMNIDTNGRLDIFLQIKPKERNYHIGGTYNLLFCADEDDTLTQDNLVSVEQKVVQASAQKGVSNAETKTGAKLIHLDMARAASEQEVGDSSGKGDDEE